MKYKKTALAAVLSIALAGCQEPKPKNFHSEYVADYTYCFNKIEKGPDAQKGKGLQFGLQKLGKRDECMVKERGWISIAHLREFEREWYTTHYGPVVRD